MIRRGAIGLGALAALLVALPASSVPANAQSPSPRPATGPSVTGQITGSLAQGSTLSIRVDATMPGGWQGLHLVQVVVRSTSQTLEELAYDINNDKLTIASLSVIPGTGSVGTGEYLRVGGGNIFRTTGGANLWLQVNAEVVKTIPDGARFDLSVTDDTGGTAEVTESLAEPEAESGFSWGTLVAFVVVALLAGMFAGNVFASRRRPPPRLSVYGSIQQRIDQEKARGRSG